MDGQQGGERQGGGQEQKYEVGVGEKESKISRGQGSKRAREQESREQESRRAGEQESRRAGGMSGKNMVVVQDFSATAGAAEAFKVVFMWCTLKARVVFKVTQPTTNKVRGWRTIWGDQSQEREDDFAGLLSTLHSSAANGS